MRLCQELFAIPYRDNVIIYAPLIGVATLCNQSAMSIIHRLRAGDTSVFQDHAFAAIVDDLRKAGLLVNDDVLQREITLLTKKPISNGFAPTGVTFLVTTRCNLRCVYCYASAGEVSKTIPFEICKAAIDLVAINAATAGVPDCHVAFHGAGEPTMAYSLIKQCVKYARERAKSVGIQASFSIVTNGVLTHEQIEWLAANMNSISVSLDGPPDIQNMQRPLRNGYGSFNKVFTAIKRLEQLGMCPFVRATITNASVSRMREISHFFSENFKTPEFQLEPVAVCGRCVTSSFKEPTVEEFVTGVEEAMEEAARLGKKAVCSAALEIFPNLMQAYCGVAAPNFAVTPEGIVTACYEVFSPSDPKGKFFYYGHYDHEQCRFVFDENMIESLQNHVIQNDERCRDCFAKWQCAGDCAVRSGRHFSVSPSSDNTDFRCRATRELVRRRLVQALEGS